MADAYQIVWAEGAMSTLADTDQRPLLSHVRGTVGSEDGPEIEWPQTSDLPGLPASLNH
jgi:hypothetical protein